MHCMSQRGSQSVGQAEKQNASAISHFIGNYLIALFMLQFEENYYFTFIINM